MKRLDTQFNEPTNQNIRKVPQICRANEQENVIIKSFNRQPNIPSLPEHIVYYIQGATVKFYTTQTNDKLCLLSRRSQYNLQANVPLQNCRVTAQSKIKYSL